MLYNYHSAVFPLSRQQTHLAPKKQVRSPESQTNLAYLETHLDALGLPRYPPSAGAVQGCPWEDVPRLGVADKVNEAHLK